MSQIAIHNLATILFALSLLLVTAKLAGKLAKKLGQPSILGEISSGILLGPTVLGYFRPHWYQAIFPATGPAHIVVDTVATLGLFFFLLAAGLETDLHSIVRQGRAALLVSFFGAVIPFATGFIAADVAPRLLGAEQGADRHIFAFFLSTALSISALPVIAKTLMDLGLLDTDLGGVIISSALLDDLVGWILFAVVLGLVRSRSVGDPAKTLVASIGPELLRTLLLVGFFAAFTLTIGRRLIAKVFDSMEKHNAGRSAFLVFMIALILAVAGLAEYAGIHAIFGVFLVAVAAGDGLGPRGRPRNGCPSLEGISRDIRQVATDVFAPFFFCSIGLWTNFRTNFSARVTLAIIAVACLGKILGARWGAHLGGMDARSSWAVGFAMNARGAMEIILGSVALHDGLIGERMFVALVIMALFTSLVSAPAIQKFMKNSPAAKRISCEAAGLCRSAEPCSEMPSGQASAEASSGEHGGYRG